MFQKELQKPLQSSVVHDDRFVAPNILREIHQLPNEDLFGGIIENSDMAQAARAGLILAAGGWDDAHRIVQEMETPEAQYWHGIVHRREPDSSNAKYWFRQVGHHVIMDQLSNMVNRSYGSEAKGVQQIIKSGRWNPYEFIDMCVDCHEGNQKELLPILLDIQQKEFTALLDYCVQHALGGSPGPA